MHIAKSIDENFLVGPEKKRGIKKTTSGKLEAIVYDEEKWWNGFP